MTKKKYTSENIAISFIMQQDQKVLHSLGHFSREIKYRKNYSLDYFGSYILN
jgi:hypothetical protein